MDSCREPGAATLPDKLLTRRLLLRQPGERDIPSVVRGLNNFRVARWLGRVPFPYVAWHAHEWLAMQRWRRQSGRDLTFVIATRGKPGAVVGGIGCHNVYEASPIVGYWLAEPHWGRGFASEALSALLAEVRRVNPAARPHAMVQTANRASVGVLRKAGFRRQPGLAYFECRARGHNVATIRYLADAAPA